MLIRGYFAFIQRGGGVSILVFFLTGEINVYVLVNIMVIPWWRHYGFYKLSSRKTDSMRFMSHAKIGLTAGEVWPQLRMQH